MFSYFIGHKITIREIRNVFGVSKSTAFLYLKEMGRDLASKAVSSIKFPSRNEYEELSAGFEAFAGLKNILLAIDGTEFQITKPMCEPGAF